MRQIVAIAAAALLLAACATPNNPAIDVEQVWDEAYVEVNDAAHDMGRASVVVVKRNGAEVLQHGYKFEQALKAGFYHGTDSFADWMTPPAKGKGKLPVPPSYCYSAMQDILCYRQPMPGWEHRLVAYQGTGALPPPPAMMQPMPTQYIDASLLPQNRVATAQPVFKEMPEDLKAKEKEQSQGGAVPPAAEPAHETLPDPALAPQL